ncbi:MAG: type II secretion system F family protein [Planctomycetota bacterium]|nr:MAG: type II secretion system F family protein [Planctomycetota bacterium]
MRYLALDAAGRERRGVVEARDPADAATRLRKRGLHPVELTSVAAPRRAAGVRSGGELWLRSGDKVLFLSQLALMLRSGLTLLHALDALAERAERAALRALAGRLRDAVVRGQALSEALASERLFPPLLAHLVRTAESTGRLDEALRRAAESIERRAALRFQVLTSLTYPAIVLLVSGGVFWFLTARVVPRIARFLAGRGVELPWTTALLVDISEVVTGYGPWITGACAAACVTLLCAYRTRRGRFLLDGATLRVPLVGGVLRAASLAHFGRTLSVLLRSGLPMLQALEALGPTVRNQSVARSLARAAEAVRRGASLSAALAGPGLTPLAEQVIAVGERTGALDDVLEELAAHYEVLVQRRLKTLASLVEPALLLVVGGLVGLVYISFFHAVFQLAR